jgi:hypothetical protein
LWKSGPGTRTGEQRPVQPPNGACDRLTAGAQGCNLGCRSPPSGSGHPVSVCQLTCWANAHGDDGGGGRSLSKLRVSRA